MISDGLNDSRQVEIIGVLPVGVVPQCTIGGAQHGSYIPYRTQLMPRSFGVKDQ